MSEHNEEAVVERIARRNMALYRGYSWDELDDDQKASFCHDARTELQDIVDCLKPGDRLPGGGVWMPEEPTDAMMASVGHYWGQDTGYCSPDDVRAIYRAMLSAAASTD